MLIELAEAFTAFERDQNAWVGLLFAEGANFTAGLELDKVAPIMRERGTVFPIGSIDPLSLRPPLRTKPLVCAVQGICFTLGIELMLAADIVVAAEDCRFAQIEVKREIMPAGGATIRMVERAGWGNAQRYLLTGDEFGAREALRLGFAQEVVQTGTQKDTCPCHCPHDCRASTAGGARLPCQFPPRRRARAACGDPRVPCPTSRANGQRRCRRGGSLLPPAAQRAVCRTLRHWAHGLWRSLPLTAAQKAPKRICSFASRRERGFCEPPVDLAERVPPWRRS